MGGKLATSKELYISAALLEHADFKTFFFFLVENPTSKLPPFKEALLNPNWRELEFWQHFVPLFLNQRATVPHNTGKQLLSAKSLQRDQAALSRRKPSPAGAGTNSTTNSPCLHLKL